MEQASDERDAELARYPPAGAYQEGQKRQHLSSTKIHSKKKEYISEFIRNANKGNKVDIPLALPAIFPYGCLI